MSSILDHVEQAVPRATVYGAMKGSPVFIGKYYREIAPSSNATEYNYANGERVITFIVASPDKTIFNDLRSAYLRIELSGIDADSMISEPVSNIIERIVIKMNGTVVEDISRFDFLTSAFKRTLLTREQKNARSYEGWNVITKVGINPNVADLNANGSYYGQQGQAIATGRLSSNYLVKSTGVNNARLGLKLDMSGIFNVQQLLSGYYSPLEIELYLQKPSICCQNRTTGATPGAASYVVKKPRLCMDQIVMSPEYVSAFESALLSNSNAQGIQIPFSTYYTYSTDVKTTPLSDDTFWVRKPVRYLRSVYWVAVPQKINNVTILDNANGVNDNYRFTRGAENDTRTAIQDDSTCISSFQVAIGTKSYRDISIAGIQTAAGTVPNFTESQIFFAKAVGHYNDYTTLTDELIPSQKAVMGMVQGLDLEFSPDNDVLASETTLNSNDIRLRIKSGACNANGDAERNANDKYRILVFLNYQASIALFPGNETRLLVT